MRQLKADIWAWIACLTPRRRLPSFATPFSTGAFGHDLEVSCPREDTRSLPQHGFDICKPANSKKRLQKQFREMQDDTFSQIVPAVHDFTQLPMEPMWSLYEAVRYLIARGMKGNLVECGVFFGGASMLIAVKRWNRRPRAPFDSA